MRQPKINKKNLITKMVECPKCHKRMTVTFLSPYDKKTCKCGTVIYASSIDEINKINSESKLERFLRQGVRSLFK